MKTKENKIKSSYGEHKIKRSFSQKIAYWFHREAIGWVLLLPSLFCFTIFLWQPLLSGIKMSFFDTKGFTTTDFIGFENYITILSDSGFVNAMLNTVKYALWSILLGLFTPVVVSIVLNEVIHAKGFFRFSTYFPCMVPSIVTSVMWLIMFDPGAGGLFNHILSIFGCEPSQWLQNSNITIPLIVVTMTWGGFGSTTILYLADLQAVNTELYEAVEIDGGGIFTKMRHITLPHMSGMIKMMFIMQIINVFQVFQQPLAMTGGGPNNASISLALVAYNYAFSSLEVGKSVATSVVTGIMIMIFTLIYMRLKKSNET